MPAGVSVLPVPTLALPKVWVNVAVSPEARLPEVMVGHARGSGGGVVDLGVGRGGDGDRPAGDHTGGRPTRT